MQLSPARGRLQVGGIHHLRKDDTAYPHEGTVTIKANKYRNLKKSDTAYPREGTVTIFHLSRIAYMEKMQLIPARGRLPVMVNCTEHLS